MYHNKEAAALICLFSVQNFKSFREEATLDLQAADIKEQSVRLLPSPNRDKFRPLLPVAALYGPNGGGKSVLLEALAALVSEVLGPIVLAQRRRCIHTCHWNRSASPSCWMAPRRSGPPLFNSTSGQASPSTGISCPC